MKTKIFSFDLPRELIAQYPPAERGESRLLVADRQTGTIDHCRFAAFPSLLRPGDVVVFNDSSVVKARLYGVLPDGTETEILLLSRDGAHGWKVLAKGKRKKLAGKRLSFPEGMAGTLSFTGEEALLKTESPLDESYLERCGHVPLPPYIKRPDAALDARRYETVYARIKGSVAAPTAGLHFTGNILDELAKGGVQSCFLTLHVGLGTFLPMKTENIEDHIMHQERYEISDEAAEVINGAAARGGRICAVGTTSVRTLETAWENGRVKAGQGTTRLFIKPGYEFKVVDLLLTNFHTPESTLLVLVSAFAGLELVKNAYKEAIGKGYRFFSYGDAMFIR